MFFNWPKIILIPNSAAELGWIFCYKHSTKWSNLCPNEKKLISIIELPSLDPIQSTSAIFLLHPAEHLCETLSHRMVAIKGSTREIINTNSSVSAAAACVMCAYLCALLWPKLSKYTVQSTDNINEPEMHIRPIRTCKTDTHTHKYIYSHVRPRKEVHEQFGWTWRNTHKHTHIPIPCTVRSISVQIDGVCVYTIDKGGEWMIL